jgi:hypothetical protein
MNASEQIPPDEARPPATPLEAMVADIQRIIAEGEADEGAPSRPGLSAEGRAVRVEEAGSRWSPAAAGRAVSIAGVAVLALGGLAWLALAAAHRPAPPVDATDQTAAAAGEDEREALRRAIEERDAEIQRLAAYARPNSNTEFC